MDFRKLSSISDYFLICSGDSNRQVEAIYNNILKAVGDVEFKLFGQELDTGYNWVLLDFGEVILHIFYKPVRDFYSLERLWFSVPRIDIKPYLKQEKET